MAFADFKSTFVKNLSNQSIICFQAVADNTNLHSINVCNLAPDAIRINCSVTRDLQKTFIVKNVLIQQNATKNLVLLADMQTQYLAKGDEVSVYSDDFRHTFDLTINFLEFYDDVKTDDDEETQPEVVEL